MSQILHEGPPVKNTSDSKQEMKTDRARKKDVLVFILWLVFTLGEIAVFAGWSDRSIPNRAWIGIGCASISGIVALMLCHLSIWRGDLMRKILRDIGIAFVVAVVVSIVYEFSTRTIGQQETVVQVINRMMSAFVPEGVWGEVTDEILHRRAIRRNVKIDLDIDREVSLPDGHRVSAPKGQAVLRMSYSYDLYAMSNSDAKVDVQHELEYELWNKDLQLPRFYQVVVTGPGENESKTYEGAALNSIYDGHGSIKLEGANAVTVPPDGDSRRVRITTERYELINTPGSYDLIMPELAAKRDDSRDPTITVTIGKVPDDMQVDVETYYAAHSFVKHDKTWLFYKTMFPGQGLTLVFKPRVSPPTMSATETK